MKLGIVTILDFNNYGNRLQNYALQIFLKSYGGVETLINTNYSNTKKLFLLRMLKNKLKRNKYNDNKNDNFAKFNNLINFSKKKYTIFSNIREYDFCIVGSDQVWNPHIGRLRELDLLSNVDSKKRISYAASFGISQLPKKYKKRIKKELNNFKAISVREEQGKKIINNLLPEKEVDVLIDPTMLLDSNEWDKVSKKPSQIKTDKYILNYFLGELSKEKKQEIDRIAKENKCEIINILDEKSPFYECGPSEFLWLEKNAFLICTDSFHSSVFAILYNRPFIIFDREQKGVVSMNSRLETLITKFQLKNRKFEGKITKENLNHDYSEAYKILEEERKKSKEFLEKALDIKE